MRWEAKKKQIGNVTVGERREIIFQALKDLPEIDFIQTSCGCTGAKYKASARQVVASFRAKPVPKHLKGLQNHYSTYQTITINYKDGNKDFLNFSAKVIEQ